MSASFPLFEGPRAGAEAPDLWSVSELTGQIRSVLEHDFSNVGVRGEISNLARPRSGHVYLQLKDESAQVRAVLWKSQAQRVVFDLEDGLAVRVFGDVTVYPPRGEYQLVIRQIEPEGIGALELAFRQVVERLKAEGLFDPARKRPLPRFPRRIVVVSSPTGAAVRDFVNVAHRRWPQAEILVAPFEGSGRGGGGGDRRGDPAGEPGGGRGFSGPGPGRREPGGPVGVQRGGGGAGDLLVGRAGGLGGGA